METKAVNTELWEYKYMDFAEGHYIRYANEKWMCAVTKENAELIVAAVNACKTINPDNPLNVAKVLPEFINWLLKQ